MKKIFSYILLIAALLSVQLTAFPAGSSSADPSVYHGDPWANPYAGATFVSFNMGGSVSYQNVNSNLLVNVLTLKIHNILVSKNTVARGEAVTISYAIENTGAVAANISNATLSFFQPTINTTDLASYFSITTIAPAQSPLAAGATTTVSFRVIPNNNRPNGDIIVDGKLTGTVNDLAWAFSSVMPSTWMHPGATSVNILTNAPATLNLSAITIVSPNGALDKTLSAGQEFWVSFNIRKIGDSALSGTATFNITYDGISQIKTYAIPATNPTFVIVTLNAGAAGSPKSVVVSIAPNDSLLDTDLGKPIGVSGSPGTLSGINVVAPASINIASITVLDPITHTPTTSVMAYQDGPVTVSVVVNNINGAGGAAATINPANADLSFLVDGTLQGYDISAPGTVRISGGGTVTLEYIINKFGGGLGICTVNATLKAYDENSGAEIVTSSAGSAVATYNVSFNASVYVDEMRVVPDPFNQRAIQVVVKLHAMDPSKLIDIIPNVNDLKIIAPDNVTNATASFNITGVIPNIVHITNGADYFITYNVTPKIIALPGVHTFTFNTDTPTASFVPAGIPAFVGGHTSATANYDPVSPNLIAATANINMTANVTAPTDNFILTLEFSETMNVTTVPSVAFIPPAAISAIVNTGTWLNDHTFEFDPMTIVSLNGLVTVNLLGTGAQDLATNIVAPSNNFLVFYVDSLPPTGAITINAGAALTINPVVTLDMSVSDTYSTNNFEFMILPSSNVSSNPGVSVNEWLPFYLPVTLNLNTDSLGTKNIYVIFRDEAGNISAVCSDDIVFDSNEIVWNYPTPNAIVSKNTLLEVRAPLITDTHIEFYVSVNGVTYPIVPALPSNQVSGTLNILLGYTGTTTNAELIAATTKNGVAISGSVLSITIDNTPPNVTVNTPVLNLYSIAYVNGTVVIAGTATDNEIVTAIDKVELTIDGVSISVTGTDSWTASWTVPALDIVPTTYNAVVTVYDKAGNTLAKPFRLVKTDTTPNVTLLSPTLNSWLDNTFDFRGTVSSLLPLGSVSAELLGQDGTTVLGSGVSSTTLNWQVTFNIDPITALPDYTEDQNPATLVVTVTTDTTPPFVFNYTFPYRVDGIAPLAVNVPSGIIPAVGTYNVTGSFMDAHSGVSAIGVSINSDTAFSKLVTFNNPVAGAVTFVLPVAVGQDFVTVSIVAWDNAWPSPNTSSVYTFVVSRDYSLLPGGVVLTPPSGSYVNSPRNISMNISGTANVYAAFGNKVEKVWLKFDSETGTSSDWLTVNALTDLGGGQASWKLDWLVPQADPHDTTYNARIRILSTAGVLAEVSPSVVAVYTKDIYGPVPVFRNIVDGMFLDPSLSPYSVAAMTHTEGATVNNLALIIDNVKIPMDFDYAMDASNVIWRNIWHYAAQPGNEHTLYLMAEDNIHNIVTSAIKVVRTVPSAIVTDPLPYPDGIISANSAEYKIFATSQNYVLFGDFSPGSTLSVYVDIVGAPMPTPWTVVANETTPGSGIYSISLNPTNVNPLLLAETVYLLNIIERNGSVVTVHYQPVVHDHTAPTVNVVFDNVTRYYPGGIIAPNELFAVNLIDRTENGLGRGSGFSNGVYGYPLYDVVSGSVAPTHNPEKHIPGSIQRSLLTSGGVTNNTIVAGSDSFDPLSEILRFKVALAQGTYDLAIFATDNAGNPLTTTFNVFDLIVNRDADGKSGALDKSQLITAYPNPYNSNKGDVLFTYYLTDNAQKARIMIYNQIGELVHPITIEGPAQEGTRAGYNQVAWNGQDKFRHNISNGVYIYLIVIDSDKGQTFVKGTMAVIKD